MIPNKAVLFPLPDPPMKASLRAILPFFSRLIDAGSNALILRELGMASEAFVSSRFKKINATPRLYGNHFANGPRFVPAGANQSRCVLSHRAPNSFTNSFSWYGHSRYTRVSRKSSSWVVSICENVDSDITAVAMLYIALYLSIIEKKSWSADFTWQA